MKKQYFNVVKSALQITMAHRLAHKQLDRAFSQPRFFNNSSCVKVIKAEAEQTVRKGTPKELNEGLKARQHLLEIKECRNPAM